MSEFARRVERLRGALRGLAKDQFAAVDEAGAAAKLQKACDQLLPQVPEDEVGEIESWRARLDGFEGLETDLKAVEVARGLRLCRSLAGAAPEERPKPTGVGIHAPTSSLPGIGPALAERLAERNLLTVEDLVWWVPRRYDDSRRVEPLYAVREAAAESRRVAVRGIVHSCRFARRGPRRWVDLRLSPEPADHEQESGERALTVVTRFFGAYQNMVDKYPTGAWVALAGVPKQRANQFEFANPDILEVRADPGDETAEAKGHIVVRYSQVPGVGQARLQKACTAAVERVAGRLRDPVPEEVAERLSLPSLEEALRALHIPPEGLSEDAAAELSEGTSRYHRRLAFAEFFALGIVIAFRRASRGGDSAPACPNRPELEEELASVLPFSLTGAQRRAIDAMRAELASERPMGRLLQGDVGSGKTAVLFAAAHQAARAGRQSALMAPTEILAEQHYRTLTSWSEKLGLRTALLTGSQPSAVKASTLSLLASGAIDIVVGTHALLSETVAFADLGLALVDEQHRFGVAQRVRLREKAISGAPHLLVTTATPIPRTLALTAYGDLDVTLLDELPPGRTPIETELLYATEGRRSAFEQLQSCLERGDRAYIVCPLVEPSEDPAAPSTGADATSSAARLREAMTPRGINVALVHGRLPADERSSAIEAFRSGEARILVATTVIEVGVDVPEATLMIIQDADRFGLAQLHQLRGRVGRGQGASRCLLLSRGDETALGSRRLAVMAETNDGFRIADEDLALRGPGELLGAKQAGLPQLRFGNLAQQTELLLTARAEAERLLTADPTLASHPELRALVDKQIAEQRAFGAEGG